MMHVFGLRLGWLARVAVWGLFSSKIYCRDYEYIYKKLIFNNLNSNQSAKSQNPLHL